MKSVQYIKSMSNNTKLRLVSLLLENELCVCELEEILHIRQANISKNLASLKVANIVDVRRERQRGFYFLTEAFKAQTHFVNHIRELRFIEPMLQKDYEAFVKHEEVKDGNIYVCNAYRSEAN